jgi:hypothetical protein
MSGIALEGPLQLIFDAFDLAHYPLLPWAKKPPARRHNIELLGTVSAPLPVTSMQRHANRLTALCAAAP